MQHFDRDVEKELIFKHTLGDKTAKEIGEIINRPYWYVQYLRGEIYAEHGCKTRMQLQIKYWWGQKTS